MGKIFPTVCVAFGRLGKGAHVQSSSECRSDQTAIIGRDNLFDHTISTTSEEEQSQEDQEPVEQELSLLPQVPVLEMPVVVQPKPAWQ